MNAELIEKLAVILSFPALLLLAYLARFEALPNLFPL